MVRNLNVSGCACLIWMDCPVWRILDFSCKFRADSRRCLCLVRRRLHTDVNFNTEMFGGFFIGATASLIFSLVTTVMVELLPHRSASSVALNSLGRNIFASIGSAIGQPLISAIGNGWALTAAAAVMLLSA